MSASRTSGVRGWLLATGQDALRQWHRPTFDNQPFGARPGRGQCDKKSKRDEIIIINKCYYKHNSDITILYGNIISKCHGRKLNIKLSFYEARNKIVS